MNNSGEEQQVENISMSVSNEISYKRKDLSHPSYKKSQLYPLSGSQNQNVSASGGNEIVFQIPARAVNLSKCVLNFNVTPSVFVSVNAAPVYAINESPLSFIRQIQLYTQSGVYLCDIMYANKMCDVVYYAETKFDEFTTNPNISGVGPVATGALSSYSNQAYPNKGAGDTRAVYNYNSRVVTNNAGVVQVVGADGTTSDSIFERTYFRTMSAGIAVDASAYNAQIPLSMLKNTIFSIDKDLYFGEVLQLRIVFDSTNSSYFIAPDFNNAAAGSTPIDGATTLNFTNISMYISIEQNNFITQQLIQKAVSEGLVVNIPYVYTYKTAIEASTSQSISLRFNRAHGSKIRRIYHAVFHPTEQANTAYMRDNLKGSKTVLNFYTLLNNDRIDSEYNISTASAQDYMILEPKLKGSAISSINQYQYKWFWCNDFTSEGPLCGVESQDLTYSSGVDLNTEQKWDIYLTTTNRPFVHYNFCVTEKQLIIRPNNIQVR